MLRLGMRTSSIFNSQHVATRCNRVAKRTQHVAPTMLRSVALQCCDRLAGALKRHTGAFFYCEAPAKRSQDFNTTYLNIVGCNMLQAFGHPVATCCDVLRRVATCCDMLDVVGSNLKLVIFFMQHLTLNDWSRREQ